MYRHGDVLIAATETLPQSAKRRPTQTIAWGEVTGHSHRIAEPGAAEVWESRGVLFLHVHTPRATLVHEEHRALRVPHGVYRVWMQREYTPGDIRLVED